MLNVAKKLGYQSFRWSISSLDWMGSRRLIRYKIMRKECSPGDIFLFHDGVEKFFIKERSPTIEMLQEFIAKNDGTVVYSKLSQG